MGGDVVSGIKWLGSKLFGGGDGPSFDISKAGASKNADKRSVAETMGDLDKTWGDGDGDLSSKEIKGWLKSL
ncbi:MAG: hypothetical protein V4691_06000, partial [Pseudomonadota bacterium]